VLNDPTRCVFRVSCGRRGHPREDCLTVRHSDGTATNRVEDGRFPSPTPTSCQTACGPGAARQLLAQAAGQLSAP
jgi:hypothetical protein